VRQQHGAARFHGRAGRHHVIDEYHGAVAEPEAAGLAGQRPAQTEAESRVEVSLARASRQARLRRPMPASPERAPDGRSELTGKIVGLIEPALQCADRVQWDGNDGVGVLQELSTGLAHETAQRLGQESAFAVFECVNDLSQ
jgi:hypothetical protein